MATRSQKKAQKAKRRAKRRQQEEQRRSRSGTLAKRLVNRLVKQEPTAWPGESVEDVAIFDEHVLAELPAEAQDYARLVIDGLRRVCSRSGNYNLETLSVISRRSPFAQWRIFLRGLVHWVNQELTSAGDVWSRLDTTRRPARIAMSLLLSQHEDPTRLGEDEPEAKSQYAWFGDIDQDLTYHSKLVRRHQVDRLAVRAATAITRIPVDGDDVTVTPDHIQWLREFTGEYKLLEPDLVQALHEVTIARAYSAPYIDMFEKCISIFRGPQFDRKSTLLRYFYEKQAPNSKGADRYLQQYLDHDLSGNTELTPALRGALASQVHLLLASKETMPRGGPASGMLSMLFGRPDYGAAEKHFEASLKAYPKNRSAWQSYEAFHLSRQDDARMKKADREAVLGRVAEVHESWVRVLPEDIEPRLALVDYLLDHDRSDEAKEHVEWLAGTRRDNPLADAMTWKWNLLEAMRLCRRKAWLAQAPACLDQAARLWPKWVADDWLPYLRAAIEMRAGDASAMDAIQPVDPASDVTGACMKLGAAQRMRVAAADLKPLRKTVDDAVARLDELSIDDLLQFASFFWDLHRTNLKYPALRMHGTKFLWQLSDLFDDQPQLVTDNMESPAIRAALLIMAHEGLFNDGYELTAPDWVECEGLETHPVRAASAVVAVCKRRVNWGIGEYIPLAEPLRKAAETSDVFYRHFYSELADDLEGRVDEMDSSIFGNIFSRFGGLEGADELSGSEDIDFECDCDDCRASRGELF